VTSTGDSWEKCDNNTTQTGVAAFWVDNITFHGAVIPAAAAQYPTVPVAIENSIPLNKYGGAHN
jgi:hypothetical protein